MIDDAQHAAFVDAWLARSAKDLSPDVLLTLLETALGALWARTKTTLGEVTLAAIAERVMYTASEKFPAFSALRVDPTSGISLGNLRKRTSSLHDNGLMEGSRFILVEFLTVLGKLTAEILTPELHAELGNVAPPKTVRVDKAQRNPTARKGKGS